MIEILRKLSAARGCRQEIYHDELFECASDALACNSSLAAKIMGTRESRGGGRPPASQPAGSSNNSALGQPAAGAAQSRQGGRLAEGETERDFLL